MEFMNEAFVDRVLRVDFMRFVNCTFERCRLVYGGYGPVQFVGCTFKEIEWTLTDAADYTLRFLGGLYTGMGEGGRELVEGTFENIRQNSFPEVE